MNEKLASSDFEQILNAKIKDKSDPKFARNAIKAFQEAIAISLVKHGCMSIRGLGTFTYRTKVRKLNDEKTLRYKYVNMKTARCLYREPKDAE